MFTSLNLENLKNKIPSIFTESASNQTSEKYKHISTAKIVNGLLSEGFVPTWAAQCKIRIANKKAYTKHMLESMKILWVITVRFFKKKHCCQ